MTTIAQVRTANDVASLFLAQKLPDYRRRVQSWVESVHAAEARGEEAYENLYLYDTCILGLINAIITPRQADWLYKMIATERHCRGKRILRHEGKAFYEGREIGKWSYGERTDEYERMVFELDVSFVREFMQADSQAVAIVARQLGD